MSTPVTLTDGTTPTPLGTITNPVITQAVASTSATKQEDVASADGDYGSASLWVRRDTKVARTTTDGDYTQPAVDSYGDVKVSPTPSDLADAAVPNAATTVAAGSLVLKASAGNLYDINVAAGASAGFIMLFNATSAPADGTVTPAWVMAIAANASLSYSWPMGKRFSTGCVMVFSTTGPFTKTISATAFLSGGIV